MLVQIDLATIILNSKVTVATAGTRVVIGSANIKSVTIKALSTNTGQIYVGNSGVTAANGFQLSAGDTVSLDVSSLSVIWIDADNNAMGVSYIAIF